MKWTQQFVRPKLHLGLVLILALAWQSASPTSSRLRAQSFSQTSEGLHSRASTVLADAVKQQVIQAYSESPLSFEANQGQTDLQVKFLSRGPGYTMFLTPGEAVLRLTGGSDGSSVLSAPQLGIERQTVPPVSPAREAVLRMKFLGANPNPKVVGQEELSGKANYFLGNDPNKWRTNVPIYARVHYQNIYRGIDLIYYGNNRQLEYDLVVRPGADPKAIRLYFEGAEGLRLDARGNLVLRTAGGELLHQRPFIYQEVEGSRQEIEGAYVLKEKNQIGFRVASYDPSKPLIIDPTLVYSTFLGGSNQDFGVAIKIDGTGSAYVTGLTYSANFPVTSGAVDTTLNGSTDVFVTKLNPAGSAPLVYSTYLGGNDYEEGRDIVIDGAGNAYVTGVTYSSDYPTTPGAFSPTSNGGIEAFVTKLNPTGSAPLVYSTYLGGYSSDYAWGIALDATGNTYITGYTFSPNFPVTGGAADTTFNGTTDTFVTKLNVAGSAPLLYSTFLGGSNYDVGLDIVIDATGAAYVTSHTASSNYPTTTGAFDTTFNGGTWDASLTKLNSTGSALMYSTYLGGAGDDYSWGVEVDGSGMAYVAGYTSFGNFPTTSGAFDTTFNGGFDAFVTKFNTAGSAPLVYSTFLGGSNDDYAYGMALDGTGSVYLAGNTASANFPTTAGALDPTFNGSEDVFVTRLDAAGSALVHSTYVGGSVVDQGRDIALDGTGATYVTGFTYSADFPTTAQAFDTSHNGSGDAFVLKITDVPVPATLTLDPLVDTNVVGQQHCVTATVKDAIGNPVPDVTVQFNVTGANPTSGEQVTDVNGKATFCYTGTNAGTDAITAFADTNKNGKQDAGEPAGAATKTYLPGAPATLTLAPPAATNQVGTQHCVTATVRDAFGNPVPGITVRFNVTGANSTGGASATNAAGQATFCYTGTTAGLDTITAFADTNNNGAQDAGEPSGAATKTYLPGPPTSLTLSPPAASNTVDTQHCVTATVRDAFGNPVPGVTVRFMVTGAVNTSGSATTNSAGNATFCYQGPPLPGADAITAFADTDNDNTQDPGEPSGTATKAWVLPVTTPLCEITITNGGWIIAANGDRATFGGNAQSSDTSQTQGQEQYQDHGPAQPMNVHSINVLAIVCDGTTSASIFGQATIDGAGSYNYRIRVQDLSEPGSSDTYGILLQNGYYSGEQVLGGGNVQIRRQ